MDAADNHGNNNSRTCAQYKTGSNYLFRRRSGTSSDTYGTVCGVGYCPGAL
jgi:hypothetical protein